LLTAKICTSTGDWLIEARDIAYHFATDAPTSPATVWITRPETSEIMPVTEGTIYVMNSAGATVSTYNLNLTPTPLP
jgi:hypothetical protein